MGVAPDGRLSAEISMRAGRPRSQGGIDRSLRNSLCRLRCNPGDGRRSPHQQVGVQLTHTEGECGHTAAWRSCLTSCSHRVRLTLRSRREACNRSRDPVGVLPGPASLAAIRRARRNTSDFDTFQWRANVSSNRTDSRSSEWVDLMFLVDISVVYGRNSATSISGGIGRGVRYRSPPGSAGVPPA